MIVRIMTEDQYRLGDDSVQAVQRMDDALGSALESGRADSFEAVLQDLVTFVRQHGQRVGVDEVVPSDVIVPAPDMTLEEARARLHSVEAPTTPAD